MNGPQHPNRNPFPQQFAPIQQPQAQPIPTALMRLVGIIRAISAPTIAVGIGLMTADMILPVPLKPSHLIGGLYGRIVAAESNAAQDMLAAQARKQAESQTLPPVIANRLNDSLQTQSTVANLADLACVVGQFFPHNDSQNPNASKIGEAMRTQGCAMGDAVRQNMAKTLRDGTMQEPQPQPKVLGIRP